MMLFEIPEAVRLHGKCVGRLDFGTRSLDYRRSVCRDCPVRAECLAWVTEMETGTPAGYIRAHELYGGLTGRERLAIRKAEA